MHVGQAFRKRCAVQQLGDAEVEQLGQLLPGTLDHHHVRRLEITMQNSGLVRRLHHRRDALEERHELRKRHRPMRLQPLRERDAVHAFHGDPQQRVLLLDAERIDMRCIRMIEPRRQPSLAQETLHDGVAAAQPAVKDLDDCLSPQQRLLAAVHRSETALADLLAKNELANLSSGKVVLVRHPRNGP